MRLRFFARLLPLLLALPAAVHAQTVPFFDTNIRDALGGLYNGPVQICPVQAPVLTPQGAQPGAPASYRLGGGGTVIAACKTVQASGGAFSTSLPDAWLTLPQHACFWVSAQDPATYTENLPGYVCVQPSVQANSPAIKTGWCTVGAGCDLGKLGPMTPPVPPILAGPAGKDGAPGPPGNAGTLATPNTAGVLYTPPGSTGATLTAAALSGAAGDLFGNTTGLGVMHPGSGAAGQADTFLADMHGTANGGQCPAAGWDALAGVTCYQGAFAPVSAGATGYGLRQLQYSGPPFPFGFSYAAQGRVYFTANTQLPNDETIGWNANPINNPFADANHDLKAVVNAAGFGVNISGTTTTLWNAAGNNAGIMGTTDSGSDIGWTPPTAGLYDVSLFVPASATNGNVLLSVMHPGTISNSASFWLHSANLPVCASPCAGIGTQAGLQNFVVHLSQAVDRVGPVAMADDFASVNAGPAYLIPHAAGRTNAGAQLRFGLHADGSECAYDGSEPLGACQDVFVFLPPGYNPDAPNRWVIHFHGANETPIVSLTGTMNHTNSGGALADTLYQAGYVLVAFENTYAGNGHNSYGAPHSLADTTAAIALLHKYLSLAPQPYLLADSQGCGVMFNAVAHGLVSPPAIAGYSCNTSLYWDAYTAEDAGSQMQYIEADFGFTTPQQYSSFTAGYDPLVNAQTPGVMQNRLAATPTQLVADQSGDIVVDQTVNSVAYVNAINQARPGTAVFINAIGGHTGAQEMNGSQLLSFFNAH